MVTAFAVVAAVVLRLIVSTVVVVVGEQGMLLYTMVMAVEVLLNTTIDVMAFAVVAVAAGVALPSL